MTQILVTLELQGSKPQHEKKTLERAVSVAQKATASMGKFDKVVADQPKIKQKPVVCEHVELMS